MKELSELLILEQFLRLVGPEIEVWVREHDPRSAEDAACLEKVFVSARTGPRRPTFGLDYLIGCGENTGGERGSRFPDRPYFNSRQPSYNKANTGRSVSSGSRPYTYPVTRQSRTCLLCLVTAGGTH